MKKNNPLISGVLGSSVLLGIYLVILSVANNFSYAIDRLVKLWYLFLPLVLGFGIQIALLSYIKKFEYSNMKKENTSVATSMGISSASMAICCIHHIGELLPLLGFSAASLFLVQYQVPIILIAIFSNLFGILIMLVRIQVNKLYLDKSILSLIFLFDMKKLERIVLLISMFVTIISFIVVTKINYI